MAKAASVCQFLSKEFIENAICKANEKVASLDALVSESGDGFSLARAMGWSSDEIVKAKDLIKNDSDIAALADLMTRATGSKKQNKLPKQRYMFVNEYDSTRSIEFDTASSVDTIHDVPCMELEQFCTDMEMTLEQGFVHIRGDDPEWLERLVVISDLPEPGNPKFYAAPRAIMRIFYALGVPRHPKDTWRLERVLI